jgi:hypothetical protein
MIASQLEMTDRTNLQIAETYTGASKSEAVNSAEFKFLTTGMLKND